MSPMTKNYKISKFSLKRVLPKEQYTSEIGNLGFRNKIQSVFLQIFFFGRTAKFSVVKRVEHIFS